jgi:hypothetical protein
VIQAGDSAGDSAGASGLRFGPVTRDGTPGGE